MTQRRTLPVLSLTLVRLLQSELSKEEFAELKVWLQDDVKARQYYVDFMALTAQLHKCEAFAAFSHVQDSDELEETGCADAFSDLWSETLSQTKRIPKSPTAVDVAEIQRLANRQLQAYLAEQERLRHPEEQNLRVRSRSFDVLGRLQKVEGAVTWVVRNTLRITAVAAVLLIAFAIVHAYRSKMILATLDEGVHAKWAEDPADANLYRGPLHLEEGFAKITFKKGTQVILQAPCEFELLSRNRMSLETGRVTAQVPPSAKGFTVVTKQATVVDYGTEFGLSVNGGVGSEVHVFDGSVMVANNGGSSRRIKQELREGHAAILDSAGGVVIRSVTSRPKLFTRRLPKDQQWSHVPNRVLDLADIVGGGSGFGTGQLYAGINVITGDVNPLCTHKKRFPPSEYRQVTKLPFVDGVFVPEIQGGFTQISTASHLYEFPPISGEWWVEISNGGKADMDKIPPVPLMLNDEVYGTQHNPAILMHANAGITFDLDAIRDSLNGTHIYAFSCVCGISHNLDIAGDDVEDPDVVFYILMDGQIRFHRVMTFSEKARIPIQFRLNDGDRFLTLAVTEGQENRGDWSFFGKPVLELTSKKESF